MESYPYDAVRMAVAGMKSLSTEYNRFRRIVLLAEERSSRPRVESPRLRRSESEVPTGDALLHCRSVKVPD